MSTGTNENFYNLAHEAYSGTAEVGKFFTLISAIGMTLLGILMIISGIFILTRKEKKVSYESVQGKIVTINGSSTGMCDANSTSCSLGVSFTYNNQSYTVSTNYSGITLYTVGESVVVYIKNNNPLTITLEENKPVPKWLGIVLILLGIFLPSVAWFWYWASRKYKPIASAEGVGGLLNIARI